MEPTGIPNNRFGTPRIAKFGSKVTAITGKTIKANLQKPTCFRTFHKKTKTLTIGDNQ